MEARLRAPAGKPANPPEAQPNAPPRGLKGGAGRAEEGRAALGSVGCAGRSGLRRRGWALIVLPRSAPASLRWLAHLLRAAEGAVRRGDPFDDDFPFDDGLVLRLAARHGVAPSLGRGLAAGCIGDPLPAAFRAACARAYEEATRRNLAARETGADLLAALAEAGAPAAPVGGWALSTGKEPVHPDPGTRPMDALELVVSSHDRAWSEALLVERGLRSRPGAEGVFADPERGAPPVVVHPVRPRDLLAPGLDPETFLRRECRPIPGGGYEPTRLASLLLAAEQGARRGFARWIWLVDLNRLVCAGPLDWDDAVARAATWRVSGALYAGLLACRELLRTPVPKEALAALAPGRLRRRRLRRSLALAMARGVRA